MRQGGHLTQTEEVQNYEDLQRVNRDLIMENNSLKLAIEELRRNPIVVCQSCGDDDASQFLCMDCLEATDNDTPTVPYPRTWEVTMTPKWDDPGESV